MNDLAIMARKLALKHIAEDADRGISENNIAMSHHGSGRGHKHWHDASDGFGGYDVSIGGYLIPGEGKNLPTSKVLVREVCGVKVNMVFSLHELYLEAKRGQVSLL